MKKLEEIGPQDILNWLPKNNRKVVGRRHSATSCPCAKCFEDLTGERSILVGTETTSTYTTTMENPRWLHDLVSFVDNGRLGSVTAGEVRKWLEEHLSSTASSSQSSYSASGPTDTTSATPGGSEE
jgi:hypothetical protein